jgi:hypothetical protein
MRFLILSIIAILFVSSCRKFEEEKVVARAEPFIPQNLYPTERLPAYLSRVVVLPAYYPDPDSTLLDFVDEVFQQELAQERIFETIILDPAYMKRTFGQSRFSSSGTLPESFLKTLETETAANAVLFTDFSSYNPYRPISLSVRSKLVDIKSGEFLWAIDETFDAGHSSIILGASIFQESSQVRALSSRTSGSVLQSPRAFSKYIASTIFSTMPLR